MVNEVIVRWIGPGAASKLNIFHFSDAATGSQMKASLEAFLNDLKPQISTQYSAILNSTWRNLDTATGALISESPFSPTPVAIVGTNAGQPLPDAVAGLIRWNTGVIVNGRFLKGRTFLPGLSVGLMQAGNFAGTGLATLNTAAANLVAGAITPVVWSRTNGVAQVFTSGSVWAEASTQRRRRG